MYSYRNHLLFTLFIAVFTNNLHGMKRQLGNISHQSSKKSKTEPVLNVCILPLELHEYIVIDSLPKQATKDNFNAICDTIHAVSLTNKQWNNNINKPHTIRFIINTINDCSHNFLYVNQYKIARRIQTSGTKNYIFQSAALYHKIKNSFLLSPYSIAELVEKGADVNFAHPQGNFLRLAVKNRNYTHTQALLAQGANPNTSELGITPLYTAIKKELLTFVELLLKYNPLQKHLTAALKTGNASIMELLLKKTVFTKEELRPAILYASRLDRDNAAAQLLLDAYPLHR